MSRSFVASSTQHITRDSAPLSAYPCTLACWFKPDNTTTDNDLVFIGDKDNSDRFFSIEARSVGIVRARVGNVGNAGTTTSWTEDTWNHACGVFTDENNVDAFLNGGGKGTVNPGGMTLTFDRVSIGRLGDSSPSNHADADIAEVAIWDVALTDGEVKTLAAGKSPWQVRPESLVGYIPLFGNESPELDFVDGTTLTVTGATAADHAPVCPMFWYPGWQGEVGAAAAPAGIEIFRRRIESYK